MSRIIGQPFLPRPTAVCGGRFSRLHRYPVAGAVPNPSPGAAALPNGTSLAGHYWKPLCGRDNSNLGLALANERCGQKPTSPQNWKMVARAQTGLGDANRARQAEARATALIAA